MHEHNHVLGGGDWTGEEGAASVISVVSLPCDLSLI